MTSADIFYAIGDAYVALFEILKMIGPASDFLFGLIMAVGIAYWSAIEMKNTDKQTEDYDRTQEYLP